MSGTQSKPVVLDSRQLRQIHHGLRNSLRARNFDEALVDRCAEDAIGKSLIELTEARAQGKDVPDPVAWVIKVAIWRSIDRLRQEERQATAPLSEEVIAEVPDRPGAAPEEAALDNLEAAELHRAVSSLPVDQREALHSYYFLELSMRAGADRLHWSEATFRRRLKSAMDSLKDRFGVPEQGDVLGIELGLAAAISLRDGSAAAAAGFGDQIFGAVESAYHLIAKVPGRLRDLFSSAWRGRRRSSDRLQILLSESGAERRALDPVVVGRAAEAATGPGGASLAKVICGGGAAVAAVCAAIIFAPDDHQPEHHPQHRPAVKQAPAISIRRQRPSTTGAVAPAVAAPQGAHREPERTTAKPNRSQSSSSDHGERALGDESGSRKERTRASTQALGVESSAAKPATTAPPAPESAPEPEPSSAPVEAGPVESAQTPTQEANNDLGIGP